MSEHLRAAREKLRGAITDIDARLAELEAFKAEEAQLREHRAQLLVLLEGACGATVAEAHGTAAQAGPERVVTPSPTPTRETSVPRVDAANRMLAALQHAARPLRYAELVKAGRLGNGTSKEVVAHLVASGRIVRTGKTAATRFHLPGSTGAAPAEPEGDRGARRAARR
jgi:hypothetical protein